MMRQLWPVARSNLRRRLGSTLVLAVLVGVAAGLTVGAAVGARRTATAFPRFADRQASADLVVYAGTTSAAHAETIRDQPEVALAGVGTGVGLVPRLPDGSPDFAERSALGALVGDGVLGRDVDRPLIVAGRLPADDAPFEIMLDSVAAEANGARVGDTFPALTFAVADIIAASAELERSGREPTAADLAAVFDPVDLVVVGIGRTSDTILVNEAVEGEPSALLSPAFLDRFPGSRSYTLVAVQLVDDATAGDYVSSLRRQLSDVELGPSEQAGRRSSFAAAVRPYWLAVAFSATVLGVGTVLLLGPTVLRTVDDDLSDRGTLAALGTTRRQLTVLASIRPTVIGLVGALVTVGVAVVSSPRFPVGPARSAEPALGVELHLAGLGTSVAAVVGVVVVAARVRAASLMGRPRPERRRPSAILGRAVRLGASPAAVAGLHATFGGGSDRTRRRLAGAGIGAALALAVAALGFGSGLGRLVDDPERFGWSWDVLVENFDTPLDDEQVAGLRDDPAVVGVVPISRGSVTLDGVPVPAIGMDLASAGTVGPSVTDGRGPQGPGEVALGTITARDLGVGVGDRLRGEGVDGRLVELEVVGTAIVPSIQLDESNQLGRGAFVVDDDFERLAGWFPSAALVDVVAGTAVDELGERHRTTALGVQRPGDVASYAGVAGVPGLLALALGLLGLAVLAHLVVGSVHRRASELAVLRALGLCRRQVATTVLWQACAQVIVVLALALPAGVLAGRLGWRWFATGIGVAADPSTPLVLLAGVVASVVVVANLVAVVPARRAATVRPATVLRAE